MSLLQKEILEKVLGLVKPGGRLVYSTCSLEPEENEEVVDYILRKHPDFTGEPFGGCFPSLGFNKDAYAVQVAPHTHETDGFYHQVSEALILRFGNKILYIRTINC